MASADATGLVTDVRCAPYAVIETLQDLQAAPPDLLPGILKTARMGYDGKGQVRVKNAGELAAAWTGLKQVPCVLEKMLPLKAEFSVIVARSSCTCAQKLAFACRSDMWPGWIAMSGFMNRKKTNRGS